MSDLDALKKADRTRIVRRAILPEDRISADDGFGPGLILLLLAGLVPSLVLSGIVIVLYVLAGQISGRWAAGLGSSGAIVVACVVLVEFTIVRRESRMGPERSRRAQDVATGQVDEIIFDVAAAKSFRDPEHGAVYHFLKLSDGRVVFDSASGEMAETGWKPSDPLPQRDLPRRRLHLLYGTTSGNLLATKLSGDSISPDGIFVLRGKPEYWPSPGTFRKMAWEKIEGTFAASDRAPA